MRSVQHFGRPLSRFQPCQQSEGHHHQERHENATAENIRCPPLVLASVTTGGILQVVRGFAVYGVDTYMMRPPPRVELPQRFVALMRCLIPSKRFRFGRPVCPNCTAGKAKDCYEYS